MQENTHALFLSHGGGPMPLLGDAGHTEMVQCLQDIAGRIGRPSAILVISAHWEEGVPTVTAAANPGLVYDYYGFPEESYAIQYPCPGDPGLARAIHDSLQDCGMSARLDSGRGFDHGLFVPLKIMYPEADIPSIQLSLVNSLDPEMHMEMGRALRALPRDNLLVIGSGFSFHNMKAFFAPETSETREKNVAFEDWLLETCGSADLSEKERAARLADWANAPGARYCHPREEHLLPLHVCYGFTGSRCSESFELQILNKKASMYLW
ncbi:DODA-type extradiol aromatic ring-opening family dioxygenase [Microbulbifer yueqingensis]|uniref:Aromatic ring-opening dioxygenase, catalytic subunit, LigB family n=1 Tax=Microbulbifer yueqingensis TaxID=658219 RepID=A0A1G9BFR5_9GAMM|nr:class III extradiol ring-cleavage dioxygenase [Microbulbifer yueqingensis]SDK38378.1 Aromatic ring-opening dioxygenase, catalytic subunit, LigB family [Microbulbifer yueqingensis]